MTGVASVPSAPSAFADLALAKLTRVLGNEKGRRVFQQTLDAVGLDHLGTADDLYVFAQQLSTHAGFEAALGGLLSVAALVRGARGDRS